MYRREGQTEPVDTLSLLDTLYQLLKIALQGTESLREEADGQ